MIVAISVFSILLIYIYTFSNTIFGGDAGDLVSAIITKGIPHPPGYPFYTMLGILFNALPIPLTPVGKIILISTFSTIGAIIVFFFIVKECTPKKYFNPFIVITALLIMSFNYIIWLYSSVIEVLPLNGLIILLLFYLGIRFYKTLKKKYLYFIVFLIGIGLTHHYTFVLVIPSIAYLIFKRRKDVHLKRKNYVYATLFCFLGLLPLIYDAAAYYFKSEVMWGNATTISGFLELFLKKGYGTFVPGPFIDNIASHRFLQLKNLLIFTSNDFMIVGLILATIGLIFSLLMKEKREKFIRNAIFINIVLYGPFFFFYANFPLKSDIIFATIETFLLIYYIFFAFLIYFGILGLYTLFVRHIISRGIQKDFLKKLTHSLVIMFFFIYPVRLFMVNFPIIYSLKNDRTAENFAQDALQSADDKSIILLGADTIIFNTQYIYHTNRNRGKNKILIHPPKFTFVDNYRSIMGVHYPQVKVANFSKKEEFDLEIHVIKPNINQFSIYSDLQYPLQGFEEYVWIPQGLLFKLVKKSDVKNDKYQKNIDEFWKKSYYNKMKKDLENNNPKFQNFFTADIINFYLSSHQQTAYYYLLIDTSLEKTLSHINEAIFLNSNKDYNYFLLSVYNRKINKCIDAEKAMDKAISLARSPTLLYMQELQTIAEKCYKTEKETRRIKEKIEKLEKSLLQPIQKL
ncbi:MAG TPA: DUF2723 domain-containing protein [Patescibacteria group bacterium]|nr:DUF2723 domain-containing protein [Patescibacteria group bacterium]